MYIFTYTSVPIHKRWNGVSVPFMFGVCPTCGVGNKLRASCKETRFYFLTQLFGLCFVFMFYFKTKTETLTFLGTHVSHVDFVFVRVSTQG